MGNGHSIPNTPRPSVADTVSRLTKRLLVLLSLHEHRPPIQEMTPQLPLSQEMDPEKEPDC
jgi:hypothetical protein